MSDPLFEQKFMKIVTTSTKYLSGTLSFEDSNGDTIASAVFNRIGIVKIIDMEISNQNQDVVMSIKPANHDGLVLTQSICDKSGKELAIIGIFKRGKNPNGFSIFVEGERKYTAGVKKMSYSYTFMDLEQNVYANGIKVNRFRGPSWSELNFDWPQGIDPRIILGGMIVVGGTLNFSSHRAGP